MNIGCPSFFLFCFRHWRHRREYGLPQELLLEGWDGGRTALTARKGTIPMFLGLPDPLVRGTDPYLDPSTNDQNSKKNLFCDFFMTFWYGSADRWRKTGSSRFVALLLPWKILRVSDIPGIATKKCRPVTYFGYWWRTGTNYLTVFILGSVGAVSNTVYCADGNGC